MKEKCVICGKKVKGFGHNAFPLSRGKCCNKCNEKVISVRIKEIPFKTPRLI